VTVALLPTGKKPSIRVLTLLAFILWIKEKCCDRRQPFHSTLLLLSEQVLPCTSKGLPESKREEQVPLRSGVGWGGGRWPKPHVYICE
jgi:hypothetical protein